MKLEELPKDVLVEIMKNLAVKKERIGLANDGSTVYTHYYQPKELAGLSQVSHPFRNLVKTNFWNQDKNYSARVTQLTQIDSFKDLLLAEIAKTEKKRSGLLGWVKFSEKTDSRILTLKNKIEKLTIKTEADQLNLIAELHKEQEYALEKESKSYQNLIDRLINIVVTEDLALIKGCNERVLFS